jgi:repressor LexA
MFRNNLCRIFPIKNQRLSKYLHSLRDYIGVWQYNKNMTKSVLGCRFQHMCHDRRCLTCANRTVAVLKRFFCGRLPAIIVEFTAQLVAFRLRVSPAYLMGWENIIPYRTKKVPMLGRIAAGKPIMATEGCEYYVEINESLHVDFCLQIQGDSMIDARILDGDLVFVRQQPVVENGEIAVVSIDNEVTLKRFYKNDGGVILKPENSKYQPKYYTEKDFKDIRILGKAIFFQSKL